MKILALDTATEACSVALLIDELIQTEYLIAPQQHTKLLLPMLEKLLAGAGLKLNQLDAIAFGCGPGSFTGLRVAASAAQALAFAWDLPVLAIPTLQAIAQGAYRELGATKALVAIDARMNDVYWGEYSLNDKQFMQALSEDIITRPDELTMPNSTGWYGIGNGWQSYAEVLQARSRDHVQTIIPERYPHAYDIAHLAQYAYQQGQAVSAEHALPVYLRGSSSWKKAI